MAILTAILPLIFQVVGWLIKTYFASEENLKLYQQMIDRANKEGLLSVQVHDKLKKNRDEIEKRLKEKNAPLK